MVQKDEWLQAEGDCFPGKTYAEVVLEPAYEQAKAELLEPMLEVNKAHLLMLREQGLIRQEEAERIAAALEAVDLTKLRGGAYTGQFEDLFFQVEHELLQHAGEAAGNLHLARSRNDMGIAIYRLTLRKKLLEAIASALRLHDRLLRFAAEHTDTVMIGYTHTQQAQPTTMAHYAAAVSDSLGRDIRRLQAAYANCNRSSMGAAALTTSGFPISRERMAELLAFDGLIENAYDAVSGADYIGEIATAVQLAALNLGASCRSCCSGARRNSFLGSWNAFIWPLIVTQTETHFTIPVGVAFFSSELKDTSGWVLIMTGATVSVLPLILLFMIFQKQIVRGIALTGLK